MTTEQELLSAGNDYIFKLIFGDERHVDVTKDFLASVLNLSDEELAVLTFTNTELKREHKSDKLSIIDIRVKTAKNSDINVEMQVVPYLAMGKRALFHWSKMFATHLSKGNDYEKLPKTIAINVLKFNMFDYERYHSTYLLKEDNENVILTDVLRIEFLEVLKIKDKPLASGDKVTQWLKFLSTQDKEELKVISKENPMIEKAVGILEVLSGDEAVRREAFHREMEICDEISRRNSAIREGKEIGRAEGRAEGEAIGLTKGKRETVKNSLAIGLSIEQIKAITGLTEEEILALKQ